jgi:type I restriction enzyme, S subunit
MSNNVLPDGWKIYRFGEIADNIRDVTPVPNESGYERFVGGDHLDSGSLKISRYGSTSDVHAQKLLFKEGHILFGKRNAYLRKVAYADFDGVCSAHMLVLQPKTEVVAPEFFPFFMQTDTFWETALMISEGSMSPTIKWKILSNQEFALPPMNEQRRSAELLWAVEDVINSYLDAEQSFESCQRVMTAKLVRAGIGHEAFIQTSLGHLPSTWEIVQLQDVAEVIYGLTVNKDRRKIPTEMPYLRVANVWRDQLNLLEVKSIGATTDDEERYALQTEDVLVVEGHADVNEIGRAAIWQNELDLCLHQNHILRVRCNQAVLPYYVLAFLNSPRGKSYFRRMAKSTSGLNTINSTVLKKMPIPLPPISEQEEIVKTTNRFKDKHNELISHIKTSTNTKKQLLDKLLMPSEIVHV